MGLPPSISLLATGLPAEFSISNFGRSPPEAGPGLNAAPVIFQSP